MTKIINLFGGPCVGKSTLAADLFSKMKRESLNVELVTEFAKDLVWENRLDALRDQVYVLGMQNRMISRLVGKVEYVITDSPILMNIAYRPESYPKSFDQFVYDLHNEYNNLNIYLRRNVADYISIGRVETYDEALIMDKKIFDLLTETGDEFYKTDIGDSPAERIFEIL